MGDAIMTESNDQIPLATPNAVAATGAAHAQPAGRNGAAKNGQGSSAELSSGRAELSFDRPDVSVVVPIFNEMENLPELRRRLTLSLDAAASTWEVVCVNDGSRDSSLDMLRQYNTEDPRMKFVSLSRNFGHQAAVTAGIHAARGKCVVLIDGDLQDPPEVIVDMVKKWREGFQVVLGERASRADGGARGIGFRLFYPLFRRVSDLPGAPDAGIFGLMDRVVVDEFNKLPERNRFIPGLRMWLGFKQGSVIYDRQDRAAGKPKQTLSKLIRYAMDGMISFSYAPLRWVSMVGFIISMMSFLLGVYYILSDFIFAKPITGFTTTIVCILFLGGAQLTATGVLGSYIGRIYEELKQRPLYVVAERGGL
jgi:dolichol-phosphate mannosyltransferase